MGDETQSKTRARQQVLQMTASLLVAVLIIIATIAIVSARASNLEYLPREQLEGLEEEREQRRERLEERREERRERREELSEG